MTSKMNNLRFNRVRDKRLERPSFGLSCENDERRFALRAVFIDAINAVRHEDGRIEMLSDFGYGEFRTLLGR